MARHAVSGLLADASRPSSRCMNASRFPLSCDIHRTLGGFLEPQRNTLAVARFARRRHRRARTITSFCLKTIASAFSKSASRRAILFPCTRIAGLLRSTSRSRATFFAATKTATLLFDSRTMGPPPAKPVAQWTPPLPPHSVENIGANEILLISTELKESV